MGNCKTSTTARASADTGLAFQTIATAIKVLCDMDQLAEVTGRRRDRVFVYRRYLDLLAEGTEPLARS